MPGFPRADQNIKIIYDASKGTTGLIGASQVYIHIGAVVAGPNSTAWEIVPTQWGTDDPKAKMKKVEGEDNIWEWEFTPNEFFQPSESQTIYRLGMVFRNVDGSREGKTDTNGDFFVDLSQGFQVTFTNPSTSSILLEINETQEISIVASEKADLSIFVNDIKVANAASADELNYTFAATLEGTYIIKALAEKDGESSENEIIISVVGPSPKLPLPAGIKKGINYVSDTEVVLVLEAPQKKNAFVIGDFND
ncbi:MAG: 1,4-alpha-glucan branching protein, partial [Cyclobacteriaceae bacterium]|nr:1,4-alpha-glucan branching protein [Cyclobacteriaceae bacterium]